MEKFAIITFPDSGGRIVEQSKILGRLPKKIVELYTYLRGPRLVDIVIDRKSKVELGNIYNIPTLHYSGNEFIFDDRKRQVKLLIRELCENSIEILSAPFISNILEYEDVVELNKNGIEVLDPTFYHLSTLYSCFPELLKILRKQLPYMDVGIWRGDTDLGEAWIYMLAPYFNGMTIGGDDLERLHGIADRVLKETGLACEVTTSLEKCIEGKNISVVTQKLEGVTFKENLSVLSYPKDIKDLSDIDEYFIFCSGLLGLPCEPVVNIVLNAWEYLTLSNSLLYILSGSYRRFVDEKRLNRHSLEYFFKMLKSYPLKVRGFVNSYQMVTYDRFRMLYFNDNSREVKVG